MQTPDAFLCSYPKSGRTWIRFVLASYLRQTFRLGPEVDFETVWGYVPNLEHELPNRTLQAFRFGDHADVPLICTSHLPYTGERFGGRPIALLLRGPLDVLVSQFFQLTRTNPVFSGDLASFVRDPGVGAADLIRYLNDWSLAAAGGRALLLTYENLRGDARPWVTRLLEHFALPVVPESVDEALAESSFENMRASELRTGLPDRTYDRADPESRRVRRGVVGGYRDYLGADDHDYVVRALAEGLMPAARRLLAEHGLYPV